MNDTFDSEGDVHETNESDEISVTGSDGSKKPGPSSENAGTSGSNKRVYYSAQSNDPPENTTPTPPPQAEVNLYDRVKKLADMIRKGIRNIKDEDNNSPQSEPHPQEGAGGVDNGNTPLQEEEGSHDNEMEEKIRKALAKMKKLDNKLAEINKVLVL